MDDHFNKSIGDQAELAEEQNDTEVLPIDCQIGARIINRKRLRVFERITTEEPSPFDESNYVKPRGSSPGILRLTLQKCELAEE